MVHSLMHPLLKTFVWQSMSKSKFNENENSHAGSYLISFFFKLGQDCVLVLHSSVISHLLSTHLLL